MLTETNVKAPSLKASKMAENLIGSEIIKIANEVSEKIKKGERIYNLTIGDFDPNVFPIPAELTEEIIKAYREKHTNYPTANGMLELRQAVSKFIQQREGLSFNTDEILISAGARPIIYTFYRAVVDPGDTVVFPVPSWNNNHYCHLTAANPVVIETKPENNFMPTADEIRPHLKKATLISLCSPLNPTGTAFSKQALQEICDLIVEENNRRGEHEKPLYLMYDQMYWVLTYGETQHVNPVSLRPEMRNYTIFIDGMSKAFAATGVRVGWAFGPQRIIDKMKAILTHVGAWAPKAEQIAAARYMHMDAAVESFLVQFKKSVQERLEAFYKGFSSLKAEGLGVDAIAPQAAIYLTVRFNLIGKKTADGSVLSSTKDITSYILNEAKIALVPFYAFGSKPDSPWYRLSVGTCTVGEVDEAMASLRAALKKLS